RCEAEAEDVVAGEGVAARLPLRGLRSAGGERDLEAANEFGHVVGVDGASGGGVEALENAVKMRPGAGAQTVAKGVVARWCGCESVEQSAQVEAGASGDDGEAAARLDVRDGGAGMSRPVACGAGLVGPVEVEAVVRDAGAVGGRGFRGADLHQAIDGDRVATDNFAVESFGQCEREGGLAAGCGAGK